MHLICFCISLLLADVAIIVWGAPAPALQGASDSEGSDSDDVTQGGLVPIYGPTLTFQTSLPSASSTPRWLSFWGSLLFSRHELGVTDYESYGDYAAYRRYEDSNGRKHGPDDGSFRTNDDPPPTIGSSIDISSLLSTSAAASDDGSDDGGAAATSTDAIIFTVTIASPPGDTTGLPDINTVTDTGDLSTQQATTFFKDNTAPPSIITAAGTPIRASQVDSSAAAASASDSGSVPDITIVTSFIPVTTVTEPAAMSTDTGEMTMTEPDGETITMPSSDMTPGWTPAPTGSGSTVTGTSTSDMPGFIGATHIILTAPIVARNPTVVVTPILSGSNSSETEIFVTASANTNDQQQTAQSAQTAAQGSLNVTLIDTFTTVVTPGTGTSESTMTQTVSTVIAIPTDDGDGDDGDDGDDGPIPDEVGQIVPPVDGGPSHKPIHNMPPQVGEDISHKDCGMFTCPSAWLVRLRRLLRAV